MASQIKKQLFDVWSDREWSYLKQHFARVTVRQVALAQIAQGELREIEKTKPKANGTFKAVFAIILYSLKNRRKIKKLIRQRDIPGFSADDMPSDLIYNDKGGGEFRPEEIPWITWLDDLFYTLGSIGYSKNQVLDLPYASINNFKLVIEFNKQMDFNTGTVQANPTPEALKLMPTPPTRAGILTKEIMHQVYENNRNAFMGKGQAH